MLPGLADAVPIRSSDFTEHERVLSLEEEETLCEPQAGDDLLPALYYRVAASGFAVATGRTSWEDPSHLGGQIALDLGRARSPWVDAHVSGWVTEEGEGTLSAEGRWTIPLCRWKAVAIPYLGSSIVSERERRHELDHDAAAWLGMTLITPNLYPWVFGSRWGNPDRFDVRLRLSFQGDLRNDPFGEGSMSPHLQAGFHGILGWAVLRGFSVTYENREVAGEGPRETNTSFLVAFGAVESRIHPFVRGRWMRLGGVYAHDVAVGLTARVLPRD